MKPVLCVMNETRSYKRLRRAHPRMGEASLYKLWQENEQKEKRKELANNAAESTGVQLTESEMDVVIKAYAECRTLGSANETLQFLVKEVVGMR